MIEAEVKRQLANMAAAPLTREDVHAIIGEYEFVTHTELSNEGIELVKRAVRRRRERIKNANAETSPEKRRHIAEVLGLLTAPGVTIATYTDDE